MVWGAIHHGDKSDLVFIDGTFNQFDYTDLLQNTILPYARTTFQHNFVYVKDNATPHSARRTLTFLQNEQVEVMAWPVCSPDMNPIEHVWNQTGVFIRDMDSPSTNVAKLRQVVQIAWEVVTQDTIAHFIDVMPRRLAALAVVCGSFTRY